MLLSLSGVCKKWFYCSVRSNLVYFYDSHLSQVFWVFSLKIPHFTASFVWSAIQTGKKVDLNRWNWRISNDLNLPQFEWCEFNENSAKSICSNRWYPWDWRHARKCSIFMGFPCLSALSTCIVLLFFQLQFFHNHCYCRDTDTSLPTVFYSNL